MGCDEREYGCMSFDSKFCTALIRGADTFTYFGFDWQIEKDADNRIHLSSDFWDRGPLRTYLFQTVKDNDGQLLQREDFLNFKSATLIDGDLEYKILATIAMPLEYKMLLYSLLKLPRHDARKIIDKLERDEADIYDKLVEYVDLYEGSPLFYEDTEKRIEKLKRRQMKKSLRYKSKKKFAFKY
ncbi:MAG: hypothetical protein MJZ34_02480 [Paludibacteraceae bacterium]|nr:hypothetical protein [Paludibacteraceae bacterium]